MEYTNQLKKYVRSLHMHKHRQKYDKFIAEGPKICYEFLTGNHNISHLFCLQEWLENNTYDLSSVEEITVVKQKELSQLSTLKTANQLLCVIDKPQTKQSALDAESWTLFLDTLQNPNNMGAIIRIADWYGIKTILMSSDTVDVYNPKVIQSAMGGHNRIQFMTCSVEELCASGKSLYGLVLDGDDIDKLDLDPGILVVGNESRGINPMLVAKLDKRLTIMKRGGAESLNAAVACGIACHTLVR